VAEVCGRRDISSALIYTWRRKLREAHAEPEPADLPAPSFAEAVMIEDAEAAHHGLQPAVVIDPTPAKSPDPKCEDMIGALFISQRSAVTGLLLLRLAGLGSDRR
jgi:hypothetical protein